MRIVCTICTDLVTDDFAAAPFVLGGHTFHYTCLSQWLAHQKTCPQCRERCLIRNVIKLFVDANDTSQCSIDDITPQEMKDKLALQDTLMKHKEKALAETKASLENVRADMQAWKTQYDSTHRKLKAEQAAFSSLKKQLSVMQHECDHARSVEKKAEKLRHKLDTMEGLDRLLKGTKDEVDTLLKNYTSSSQLATFVIAMKRDYDALKEKKVALQKEKDKVAQDASFLKKQLRSKDTELKTCRDSLSSHESDLKHAEQENQNLRKKVEVLERAIESPGSKAALKRILESPMPIYKQLEGRRSDLTVDLGASPLLASHSKSQTERDQKCLDPPAESKPEIGSKRPHSDCPGGVLLPINKMVKAVQTSERIASGFNGMGGQSMFLIPKSKRAPSKGLKFAPRLSSNPKAPISRLKQESLPKFRFGHK